LPANSPAPGPASDHRVIRWFVGRYGVNMAEAANPDIASYKSFNEFFTRPLKDGARPFADADFLCPVDGAISQFGAIERDQIFQAKGHSYSTTALVGGDRQLAAQFENGSFATLYLSPRDYHRIHMPCDGKLLRMIHVPGELFSVNPTTARGVPGLFARNERVVCVFDTPAAPSCWCWSAPPSSAAWPPSGMAWSIRRARRRPRMALRRAEHRAEKGRGDGPLPARLDRRHAVPEERPAFNPAWQWARRPPPSAWARHRWASLDRDKGWRPLIVCWRGGMRSGAMTTVFRSIGWDACQLDGGYKTFRTHVLTKLETLPGQYRYQVLGGPTGSAKTRVLQAIAEQGGQVLDLEEIACHKGSVLGRLPGQPQPSQKWFETAIWQTLRNFDPALPVFVEAESRKIGNLRLPAELFTAMQSSPICEICADIPQRVDFLLRDYDYFTQDALNLKKHLDALRTLLGHERVNAWHEQIDQHDFAGLTGSLLQHHYDPLYARARQRDYSATPTTFTASTLDEAEIARLAAAIMETAPA
jgi:tRNA 2-selenouridine synthase